MGCHVSDKQGVCVCYAQAIRLARQTEYQTPPPTRTPSLPPLHPTGAASTPACSSPADGPYTHSRALRGGQRKYNGVREGDGGEVRDSCQARSFRLWRTGQGLMGLREKGVGVFGVFMCVWGGYTLRKGIERASQSTAFMRRGIALNFSSGLQTRWEGRRGANHI